MKGLHQTCGADESHRVVRRKGRLIGIVADAVVAQLSVRGAQFEEREYAARSLHEFLLREDPARRHRGEESPAVAFLEAARTVVAEVRLGVIFRFVVVVHAAEHRDIGVFVGRVVHAGSHQLGGAHRQIGVVADLELVAGGVDVLVVFVIVLDAGHDAQVMVAVASQVDVVVGEELGGVRISVRTALFEVGGRGVGEVRGRDRGIVPRRVGNGDVEVLVLFEHVFGYERTRDFQTFDGRDLDLELAASEPRLVALGSAFHHLAVGVDTLFSRGDAAVAPLGRERRRHVAHRSRRAVIGIHRLGFAHVQVERHVEPFGHNASRKDFS